MTTVMDISWHRVASWAILAVQVALVGVLGAGIVGRWFPLGVPGEWVWLRARFAPEPIGLILAALAIVAYGGLAAVGQVRLGRASPRRLTEWAWVLGLFPAAVFVQLAVTSGAATGLGLTKWVTLAMPGSSGYHTVARRQVNDPGDFWARYPTWVRGQDSLHIGTHPPGLILVAFGARRLLESHPSLASGIDAYTPGSITSGFREITGPQPLADRAAVVLLAALTMLACGLTVVPIYGLARTCLDAPGAWTAACLWPLVPSAILFQPTADTAFPLLSTTALALAAWSLRWRGRGGEMTAFAAGVVLGVGMQLTLAFLAVGLIVALVLCMADSGPSPPRSSPFWRRRLVLMLSVGAGFLALTLGLWALSGANPFVIWWWNQANHARFYDEYPRTYWTWVLVNPVELAVGVGLPVFVWALAGFATGRRAPAVSWATVGTMAALTLGGRNLSEVGRLWLPIMPPLLVVAAAGMTRLRITWKVFILTVVLLGLQTLVLQATVQVVYPI